MRRLIVLFIIIALVSASCGLFQSETAILWTDQPEFAVYAEQFNLTQTRYKIEIKFMKQPAQQLVITNEYPDIIVGNWLKSSSTRTFFMGLDELFKDEKKFILLLGISVSDKKKFFNMDIEAEATFEYDNMDDDKLEKFLIMNAPALLFPYIRAYISNITALSGISTVLLPTLNMTGLSDILKNNIKYK